MIRCRIDDEHEDGRYFEARLYPSKRLMHAATRRLEHRAGGDESLAPDVQAAVLHQHKETYDAATDTWILDTFAGFIMLHANAAPAEYLAHEATHAAIALYRERHRGSARSLARSDTPKDVANEEQLAWSVGKLTRQLVNFMHDAGVWEST